MREPEVKRMQPRWVTILLAILFLGLMGIGWQAISRHQYLPVNPNDKAQIEVHIPESSSAVEVAHLLKENNLIRSERAFLNYCKRENYDSQLKAGIYSFSRSQTLQAISLQLVEGKGLMNSFTVPEGYTLKQIGDLLVRENIVSQQDWQQALRDEYDYEFLSPQTDEKRLEGFLFPDTYSVGKQTTAHEIINNMLANFARQWSKEFTRVAKDREMSVRDVVIVASLIEKEARIAGERKRIAGVIYNRLNINMPLQIDATILYSLGQHKQQITNQDLQVNSPYNTYRHTGLPPGPIACPGKASIEAALYPEKHTYYYYVAQGDGSHYFSKTFAEHEQARQKYQR